MPRELNSGLASTSVVAIATDARNNTRAAIATRPRCTSPHRSNPQWAGTLSLAVGLLLAAFCYWKGGTAPQQFTRAIEDLRPGDRVLTNASDEALASAIADNQGTELQWEGLDGSWTFSNAASPLAGLSPDTAKQAIDDLRRGGSRIDRGQYRLVVLRAEQLLPDGAINDINVESIQSTKWIDEHGVRVGGDAPLPLDLVDMGLPENMRANVIDILPCPKLRDGPGRLVLTTINSLSQDVVDLTLHDKGGHEESIRPTANHQFYSVTRGEWLGARDLQTGERLEGVSGPVTVAAIEQLPGRHRVYNLTVQGEHVYRVTHLGVLVHNNGCRVVDLHPNRSLRLQERLSVDDAVDHVRQGGDVMAPDRSTAERIAREVGGGEPIFHRPHGDEWPHRQHLHPTDAQGNRLDEIGHIFF